MSVKEKKNFSQKLDSFWGITKSGSSFKVEIFAGLATFLAMAYILTVNPGSIIEAGPTDPKWSTVFIATAIGAVIGTLLMALLAKMPLAQASGMGLNNMVGAVIGGSFGFAFSFGNAMLLILISGVVFLLLSVIPGGKNKETGKLISLREVIYDGMPVPVRNSITVGIGLFIAFIGFQGGKLVNEAPGTLLGFIDFTAKGAWTQGGPAMHAVVALFGLLIISILSHYKVKGAVIIGILAATILSIPLGVSNIDVLLGHEDGVTWNVIENFKNFFSMDPEKGGVFLSAFTEGTAFPEGSLMTCIMLIVTFAMVDMFDTMGTVVGCTTNAGLVDETGKPLNYDKIMLSDSIATVSGALMGTSTVTTFVESGAGVAEGGKTGFTAFVTAILFALSIFLLPLFAFIPKAAAASALIYVGVLMMSNVTSVDFKDPLNATPSFLTIIIMILGYSITKGIGVGIISYVVISTIKYIIETIKYLCHKGEKPKWEVSVVSLVITALFLVYFLVPIS